MELPAPPQCKLCKKDMKKYVECGRCCKTRYCFGCDNTSDKMRWVETEAGREEYVCDKCIKKYSLRDVE
jgi:hypothetical protein